MGPGQEPNPELGPVPAPELLRYQLWRVGAVLSRASQSEGFQM